MTTRKKKVTAKAPVRQRRKVRQPKPPTGVARLNLAIPDHLKQPGFFYYWALDDEVDMMLARDYTFVTDRHGEFEDIADEQGNQSISSAIVREGKGAGRKHYLMCIPQEYYDQDQQVIHDAIDAQERFIYEPDEELKSKAKDRRTNVYTNKTNRVSRKSETFDD